MAARTTVWDDLDDATAQVIIQWELEDIANLALQEPATQCESEGRQDDQVARRIYEAELKAYRSLRGFTEPETLGAEGGEGGEDEAPPQEPAPPACIPRFDCTVCGDSNVSDNDYPAPCGHHYCGGCLSDLFSTSLTDERFYPPRCCSRTMPFEDARVFLNRDVETTFDGKKEEMDDKDRTYCHVPTCSIYITQSQKDGDVATCPICYQKTCVTCSSATHDGDCPKDEGVQSVIEAAQQEGWQRCYSCKRMVELTIGCHHITCVCKAQFCYVCGVEWRNCDCPHFREDRLLARATEVANREGRNAAAIAAELRQNHECNGQHRFRRAAGGGHCDECGDYLRVFLWRCNRCHTDMCNRCRFNR